jgi:uncharacterized protein YdhG (YjbR/CyaY superfamily)
MNSDKAATKSTTQKSKGFTDDEKAAMKARAKELKEAQDKEAGESAALEAIAKLQEPDRTMAKRLHKIIKASGLSAKTWYGMPAYANKDGKIVCYFRDRQKFKERYAMFGFNDSANLDEGTMWPIAYALPKLTSEDEAKIAALVKKAVN